MCNRTALVTNHINLARAISNSMCNFSLKFLGFDHSLCENVSIIYLKYTNIINVDFEHRVMTPRRRV